MTAKRAHRAQNSIGFSQIISLMNFFRYAKQTFALFLDSIDSKANISIWISISMQKSSTKWHFVVVGPNIFSILLSSNKTECLISQNLIRFGSETWLAFAGLDAKSNGTTRLAVARICIAIILRRKDAN